MDEEKRQRKSHKPAVGPIETSQKQERMFYLKIDPIVLLLSVVSFSSRFYNLEYPRAIVFDELHYIKFITLYLKRIFFFDTQPPFGKQLMTLVANLLDFKGDLDYSLIGNSYRPEVPVLGLRLLPCIFGSLIVPICYSIALELNFRQSTAALIGCLLIIENSLIVQSKFLLLDPILIALTMITTYFYLKFHKNQSIAWLCLATSSATLAACTKYSGFYTLSLLWYLVIYTWWFKVLASDESRKNPRGVIIRGLTYSFCIISLPIFIYTSIHYAHLTWLTKAGPHDNIMTSAFQASLENGLASIIRGQPLEIIHGSQITLRHTHGRSCWLHSHEHLYPIKYSDGRGSSHQQQVTCYSFKDVNNWWVVKRPHIDELVVSEPHDKIKNGDIIQLVHGSTGRLLNSHDVASSMSPYSQEVSCYVDHNISMHAQNVWQVRLKNPQDTNNHWHTIDSEVQLVHLNSSLALKFSGRQLPDWGFHQHEIVADKDLKSLDTIWNVEEHRHTKSEDQNEREIQLGQAEFVPSEPTSLTFFEKFYELHYKLLNNHQDSMKDHIYACDSPLDWMFQLKGTAYWADNSLNEASTAQIFLIGNVDINLIGIVSILTLGLFLVFYTLRRRRQIFSDIDQENWMKLQFNSLVLFSGYLFHLLPYFLYESPLFLQYYSSALIFKIIIIGALVEHMYDLVPSYLPHGLIIFIIAKSFDTFRRLSSLTYGTSLIRSEIEKLRWKDTWQLINS